jgi:hypothetical protein
MSNKVYDILKWVAMVLLPASSVLYVALANVWGWSYATEVATSVAALVAFLGALLQISSAKYNAKKEE